MNFRLGSGIRYWYDIRVSVSVIGMHLGMDLQQGIGVSNVIGGALFCYIV